LCSCSSGKIETNVNQNADNYIENEDCQNYISEMASFVKVNEGYYFTSDSKLFYFDTKSYQAYPVCSKTNCDHSDANCQAYLSPTKFYPEMSMYYYDNALYLLGHEDDGTSLQHIYMYQISLENFKQKKAAHLFDGTNGISIVCALHRGYVYFANCTEQMEETTATLCRVKLGDLSENGVEKIFEFKGIDASIARLSAYGNNVFFNTSSYADTQGNGYETTLNYINIHTLESETIPERKYSHFAEDNKVYYCKDENTINYFNLNTEENEFFCDVQGPCYISGDNNYIYLDNLQSIIVGKTEEKNRKIFVYDKSGNYITEITPKNPKDDCYFGGDDIMIFKEIIIGETVTENGANGYYVLDKSQLTSSDKQFVDME
jgi:hypothetical protein